MQNFVANRTTDFAVYKQVIRGTYNPVNITKPAYKSAFSLVRSANTCIVCSAAVKNDAEQYIAATDLMAFGYHSTNDFDISYTHNEKLKVYQAVIVPRNIYPLSEDIALPDPPDEKGKIFQDFIADEFERVKLRAEYIMFEASQDDKIHSFACRNLQLLRKLYHDSRISFNKLCSGKAFNQSDLFILYTLNLFIIRSIVFYAKFFKPYLNEESPAEQSMRNTFHNEMPRMLKYPWLFIQRPPLYEMIQDCPDSSKVSDINLNYKEAGYSIKPDIPDSLMKELQELVQLKNSIKLNGPMNILVDAFYKLMNKPVSDDLKYMEATSAVVSKVLSFLCVDKDNEPLNPNTIRAILKPSNFTKRPGIEEENNK